MSKIVKKEKLNTVEYSEKAFERLKKIAVEEVPGKSRNYFVSRDKRARDNYLALRLNQGNRIGKQTIYDFI